MGQQQPTYSLSTMPRPTCTCTAFAKAKAKRQDAIAPAPTDCPKETYYTTYPLCCGNSGTATGTVCSGTPHTSIPHPVYAAEPQEQQRVVSAAVPNIPQLTILSQDV
ncbi:hypothetical protein ABW20_dc0102230 [Dactylellina cionopaga]|nr:hypothetical protein ABW20_dc0102230 [Dactylellina cionopaga]